MVTTAVIVVIAGAIVLVVGTVDNAHDISFKGHASAPAPAEVVTVVVAVVVVVVVVAIPYANSPSYRNS